MEYLIVSGPQGAPSRHSLEDLHLTTGDLGHLLIMEAYQCFCAELKAAREAKEVGVSSLPYPRSVEEFILLDNQHQDHQAIKSFQHCLAQALNIFSIIKTEHLCSIEDMLNSSNKVIFLGFCTGALTAQAFATSTRLSQLIYRLVEAFRLAFWIGLRVTQKKNELCDSIPSNGGGSWCIAASHCSTEDMLGYINEYKSSSGTEDWPWITVVSTSSKISIGGKPKTLESFRDWLAATHSTSRVQLRSINLNAPYHTNLLLESAACQVRHDVKQRNIDIGSSLTTIQHVYDNVSGKVLQDGDDLLESLLTSIMLQTSSWDLMLENALNTIQQAVVQHPGLHLHIINAGPDNWHASDVAQRINKSPCQPSLGIVKTYTFSPSLQMQPWSRSPELTSKTQNKAVFFSGTRPENKPVAITAAFFGEAKDSSVDAVSTLLDQAARHLAEQAATAYIDDSNYSSHMGCFFNEEEPVKGQGLGVLRRLVNNHSWPDPSVLGHVSRPGILPTINRAITCLKQELCKFVLVGGSEVVFGRKRRVAYLLLESFSDAQESGTRPLAIVLNSTAERQAKEHRATIKKLLEVSEVEPETIKSFSGPGGNIHMVSDASFLYSNAPQQHLFESEALDQLLTFFGQESTKQGVMAEQEGLTQADIPHRSLLYHVDAFNCVAALVCQAPLQQSTEPSSIFIGLSGDTEKEVEASRLAFHTYCRNKLSTINFEDLSFATLTRSEPGKYRFGVTALSPQGIMQALSGSGSAHQTNTRKLAYIFPGQGCQYISMGVDLYQNCLPFRQRMNKCDLLARSQGFPGFLTSLYDNMEQPTTPAHKTTFTSQESSMPSAQDQEKASAKDQADQLAIFSIEVSLAEILIEWGLQPTCVSGHSLGHYAACYIAGVLSLSDSIFLVACRSTLFRKLCEPKMSQMMAVASNASQVLKLIAEVNSDATIACFNGPSDVVLSGTRADLSKLHQHIRSSGIKAKLLEVPFGFHSSHVKPVVSEFLRAAYNISFAPPKLAITSNILGRVVQPGEKGVFTAQYFANHIQMPVQFAPAISLARSELDITDWVEIGPNPICLPMIKSNPDTLSSSTNYLFTIKKGMQSQSSISATLGKLWLAGCDVSWKSFLLSFGKTYQSCNDLPLSGSSARVRPHCVSRRSTFESLLHQSYSIPQQEEEVLRDVRHLPLGPWLDKEEDECTYTVPFSHFSQALQGHRVAGVPVFSASLHGELALQTIYAIHQQEYQAQCAVHLSNLMFRAPLVPSSSTTFKDERIMKVDFDKKSQQFTVSCAKKGESPRVYMVGQVECLGTKDTVEKLNHDIQAQYAMERVLHMTREKRIEGSEYSTLASDLAYKLFSQRVEYCKDYQTIQSITLAPLRLEAKGEVEALGLVKVVSKSLSIDSRDFVKNTVLQPMLHDVMLHSGGMVANQSSHLVQSDESFIGARVGDITFSNPCAISADKTYKIYVRVLPNGKSEVVTETYLFDEDCSVVLGWARGVQFRKMKTSRLQATLKEAQRDIEKIASHKSNEEKTRKTSSFDSNSITDKLSKFDEDDTYFNIVLDRSILTSAINPSDMEDYTELQLAALGITKHNIVESEEDGTLEDKDLLFRLFPFLRGCDYGPGSPNSSSPASSANTSIQTSRKGSRASSPSRLSNTSEESLVWKEDNDI